MIEDKEVFFRVQDSYARYMSKSAKIDDPVRCLCLSGKVPTRILKAELSPSSSSQSTELFYQTKSSHPLNANSQITLVIGQVHMVPLINKIEASSCFSNSQL